MIGWLIERRLTVALIVLATSVMGIMAYEQLPREAFPDVEIPFVMVSTPYPGVSPADVESLLTIPLENQLAAVDDLVEMSSMSSEGMSVITLELAPEASTEEALQQVRDRVSRARAEMPEDVEETDVREIAISDMPVLLVTLGGGGDEIALKRLGERLEDDIERLGGVMSATLSGGREREIRVQVNPDRLAHYELGLNDVIGAIADENVNIPGGDIRTGDANFLLRVPGEFEEPAEIEGVAVKRVGDRPVFVRDVAQVIDGWAERQTYARLNGQSAVTIAIMKRPGANVLEVADAVRAVAAEHARSWPAGISHRVTADQSKIVRDMVSELENGIITALILVVGVLLFFMGVRNSLFVAISIPLSMLLSMLAIHALGMTLNMIVLFALILALGMLVDNAIVIVENVYRHMELGKDLLKASIDGTGEVAGAVAASTATTVAAFGPLLFWTGMMGEFMGYLPMTVVIVLIASLIVAVLVLPVITSTLMKPSSKAREEVADTALMRGYRRLLRLSIRHRYIASALGLICFVGTILAYARMNHGTEFMPETEPNRATITIRAPDGTDLEATDAIVRQVEAILAAEPNVDVFVAETGMAGGSDPFAGSSAASNQARITLDFLPDRNTAAPGEPIRLEPSSHTVERLREAVASIAGAAIAVEKERMGPPVGPQVQVRVRGDEFHRLGELAAGLRRSLDGIAGVTDLSDDYRVGRPEMRLRIDRSAAKRVGASTRDVASTIRTAVAGARASVIRDGEDEHEIRVELDPRFRDDLQAVLAMRIPGREDTAVETFPVPISTVASYELIGGSGAIRHVDQDLVVTIRGDVEEGLNENEVRERVAALLAEQRFPEGYGAAMGGADDEQEETKEFLSNAFMIAILLILIVLVGQFNRIMLPGIILVTVLLSLIGVLWGLLLTSTPFGVMMTGLGVISLAGIVVNNAIVLLDYVEQLRARGVEVLEALVEAGATRFRPVVLTALTTVLGLVPMAVGVSFDFRKLRWIVGSESASWWGPMAIAVIFGLGVSTLLTLVMVPTLYGVLEDIRELPGRIRRALGRGAAPESGPSPESAE